MIGYEFFGGYWWLFPLVMIFFCIFMRRGCSRMMCGCGEYFGAGDSAMEILKKRYVSGEINLQEFEEKKRKLTKEK